MPPVLSFQASLSYKRGVCAPPLSLPLQSAMALTFWVTVWSFMILCGAHGAPLRLDSPADVLGLPAQQAQPAPKAATQARKKAPPAPIRLFGTVEFRSLISNLPKWERVLAAEQAKPSFTEQGLSTGNKQVAARWRQLREQLAGASLAEKAYGVNAFFNQWPYKWDRDIWGVSDYWATPREFVRKSGDCEDYAIAKYYALRSLGVPVEHLRIAAVYDSIRGIGHAVAIVFMDGDAYVLDNLTNALNTHSMLMHYQPEYSVNEKFLWRHIEPTR